MDFGLCHFQIVKTFPLTQGKQKSTHSKWLCHKFTSSSARIRRRFWGSSWLDFEAISVGHKQWLWPWFYLGNLEKMKEELLEICFFSSQTIFVAQLLFFVDETEAALFLSRSLLYSDFCPKMPKMRYIWNFLSFLIYSNNNKNTFGMEENE